MHVERRGDRDVRTNDLANRVEDVALGVRDRLGGHRPVKRQHHAIDLVPVFPRGREDAVADRGVGVVRDDRDRRGRT